MCLPLSLSFMIETSQVPNTMKIRLEEEGIAGPPPFVELGFKEKHIKVLIREEREYCLWISKLYVTWLGREP